jgi:hypothetical protein
MIINIQFRFVGGIGKRFALGFAVDRYSLNIDFGPFWIGLEF